MGLVSQQHTTASDPPGCCLSALICGIDQLSLPWHIRMTKFIKTSWMGISLVSLLTDTSVASLIAAPELMMRADDLTSEYHLPVQIYLIADGMWFLMAFPLSMGVRWLERTLKRNRVRRRRA